MTTDTPRTYAEAEVKNYCDHKFVSVQECTLCGKTFDVLPSGNECWEGFEAVCNKIKAEAEVERLKEKVIAAKESEAVWKTERDKADQRRLEAEADVERIQYINSAQATIIDGAKTEMEKLQAEVERLNENLQIAEENLASLRMSLAQEEKRAIHFQHYCKKAQDMYNYRLVATSEADERAEKAEAEVEG